MVNQWLGWFLVVMGMLFILLAFLRAALETLRQGGEKSEGRPQPTEAAPAIGVKDLLETFGGVLKQLANMPEWFLLALVGVLLIIAGQRALAGLTIVPFLN
jgi:hypothetical protein